MIDNKREMLETIYQEIENIFIERNILKNFQSVTDSENNKELKAEITAFQFMENNQNGSDWGTYFGSYARFPQQDGSIIEIPSIYEIDENMISHWTNRIDNTNNPVLKARYSGLVWDFSFKILDKKPSHQIAVTYISSLLEIVEKRLQNSIDLIRKIKRALSLSVSINNKELIIEIKSLMLDLEDEIGENDKPGLWGFSFDSLVNNSKIVLPKKEEQSIIDKLEQRLIAVTTIDLDFSTWASENIIKRLAPYYKKKNQHKESYRVLLIHGKAVKEKKEYSMLLQYQHALKELQKIYSEYGMKQESNILLKEIKDIGVKVLDEMKLHTSEISMTREEINQIVIPITTGTKKQVFHNLIFFFTPKKDLVVKALEESAKKHVLSDLFGTSIYDETGREVANVGTLNEDLTGNIIHYIGEDLQLYSFYTDKMFRRIIYDLKYTVEDFIDFIKESPVIPECRINVIQKGIQAYYENDFIVCEHLLIPQIETIIRNLIEQNGGVVLEPSSLGGFQLKTFNKLLLDEIILRSLGEDVQLYFRALFTDPRAWNLRNKISHGLSEPNSFNKSTSERVIHSILLLGALRKRSVSKNKN